MSLSNQKLDINDDLGFEQLREIGPKAPLFTKTASICLRETVTQLEPDQFALRALTKEGSEIRRFPICSKADTWLSCAYFEKNAHKLPEVAAKLTATHLKFACATFELEPGPAVTKWAADEKPVFNLYVENMDMKKTASATKVEDRPQEGRYALPGRYPLFNEGFVKKAASYFVDYFGQFDPADRHAYARNVLDRAAELNVELGTEEAKTLRKVAGGDYGDRLGQQIKIRQEFAQHNPEALSKLDKIASVKDQADPVQFAQLLERWDSENGMTRSYGRHLLDPYQSTFDSHFKKEATVWEDESQGVSLTAKELEKAASEKFDKIRGYFGETLASSLQKDASAIFLSLPSDAQVVIARIAKGSL